MQREANLRAAIDKACLAWVDSDRWPRMDPETAVFVFDRIVEARFLAVWLAERGLVATRPGGRAESRDVMRWLLIDSWAFVGIYRWRARYGEPSP